MSPSNAVRRRRTEDIVPPIADKINLKKMCLWRRWRQFQMHTHIHTLKQSLLVLLSAAHLMRAKRRPRLNSAARHSLAPVRSTTGTHTAHSSHQAQQSKNKIKRHIFIFCFEIPSQKESRATVRRVVSHGTTRQLPLRRQTRLGDKEGERPEGGGEAVT